MNSRQRAVLIIGVGVILFGIGAVVLYALFGAQLGGGGGGAPRRCQRDADCNGLRCGPNGQCVEHEQVVVCEDTKDCARNRERRVCNTTRKRCAECTQNSHCTADGRRYCDTAAADGGRCVATLPVRRWRQAKVRAKNVATGGCLRPPQPPPLLTGQRVRINLTQNGTSCWLRDPPASGSRQLTARVGGEGRLEDGDSLLIYNTGQNDCVVLEDGRPINWSSFAIVSPQRSTKGVPWRVHWKNPGNVFDPTELQWCNHDTACGSSGQCTRRTNFGLRNQGRNAAPESNPVQGLFIGNNNIRYDLQRTGVDVAVRQVATNDRMDRAPEPSDLRINIWRDQALTGATAAVPTGGSAVCATSTSNPMARWTVLADTNTDADGAPRVRLQADGLTVGSGERSLFREDGENMRCLEMRDGQAQLTVTGCVSEAGLFRVTNIEVPRGGDGGGDEQAMLFQPGMRFRLQPVGTQRFLATDGARVVPADGTNVSNATWESYRLDVTRPLV